MGARLEIAGVRFGRLTAIESVSTDRFGRRVWRCQCDCGAEHLAAANTLRSGDCGSCGCKATGPVALPPGVTERNSALARMKAGATSRGLIWAISDAHAFDLMGADCNWCGGRPSNVIRLVRRAKRAPFVYSGIDRVNNDLGYEPDNVVACCGPCNWMKRDLPVEGFLNHVARIVKRQGAA